MTTIIGQACSMIEYVVTLNDKKKKVALSGNSKIFVDKKEYECDLIPLKGLNYLLKVNNIFFEVTARKFDNYKFSVSIKGNNFETAVRSLLQEKASELLEIKSSVHHKTEVKAPMPGMILKIKKNAGEIISQGETIMILEAMKMENDLRAPNSGLIKNILVKEGAAVEKGAALFTIE